MVLQYLMVQKFLILLHLVHQAQLLYMLFGVDQVVLLVVAAATMAVAAVETAVTMVLAVVVDIVVVMEDVLDHQLVS